MSATLIPSAPNSPSRTDRPTRSASPTLLRPILIALAVFVGIGGIGLITGAVVVFNVLVFTLFTVLWIAFAATLALSLRILDDVWQSVRALPLVIQASVWLVFLPTS